MLLCCRSIFLHRCHCCVTEVYSYIAVVVVLQKYILTQMSLLCCRSINVQNYRSVTVAWSLAAVPCSTSLLQLIPPPPPPASPPIPTPLLPGSPYPLNPPTHEYASSGEEKSCYTSQFETSLCQAHQPCTRKGSPSHLCAPDFCSSRVHVCVIRIKGKEKEKKKREKKNTLWQRTRRNGTLSLHSQWRWNFVCVHCILNSECFVRHIFNHYYTLQCSSSIEQIMQGEECVYIYINISTLAAFSRNYPAQNQFCPRRPPFRSSPS